MYVSIIRYKGYLLNWFFILYLHRALIRITQSEYQPMHSLSFLLKLI